MLKTVTLEQPEGGGRHLQPPCMFAVGAFVLILKVINMQLHFSRILLQETCFQMYIHIKNFTAGNI